MNIAAICYQMPGYQVINYVNLGKASLDTILYDLEQDFAEDQIIVNVELWIMDAQGMNHCYTRDRKHAWILDDDTAYTPTNF